MAIYRCCRSIRRCTAGGRPSVWADDDEACRPPRARASWGPGTTPRALRCLSIALVAIGITHGARSSPDQRGAEVDTPLREIRRHPGARTAEGSEQKRSGRAIFLCHDHGCYNYKKGEWNSCNKATHDAFDRCRPLGQDKRFVSRRS